MRPIPAKAMSLRWRRSVTLVASGRASDRGRRSARCVAAIVPSQQRGAARRHNHGLFLGREAVECMAFGPCGAAQRLAHSSSGPAWCSHCAQSRATRAEKTCAMGPLLPCRRAGGARPFPRRRCWRPAGRGRLLPGRYGRAVAGATPGSTSNARMNRLRESASPFSTTLSPRAIAARCARSELI